MLDVILRIQDWDIFNYRQDIPIEIRKSMQKAIAKTKGEI